MSDDDIVENIRKKYERLSGVLDERSRRAWATSKAEALGYGGQSIVAKASGLSRMTFYAQNLDSSNENNSAPPHPRIRKEGGMTQEVDIGAGSISGTNDSW
jgi:hypothetical protein